MPTDPILSEATVMFVAYMHGLLKQGGVRVVVKDPETKAVIGTEIVDFSPAQQRSFETFLHHWGMSQSTPADLARGGSKDLMDRARARAGLNLVMPPLSEKDDDAMRTGT